MKRLKKGIRNYFTYFNNRKIKENENYALTTKDGLEFYVNENKTLTWANTATSDRLKAMRIKGDLYSINPREVLARKKWWIEKR